MNLSPSAGQSYLGSPNSLQFLKTSQFHTPPSFEQEVPLFPTPRPDRLDERPSDPASPTPLASELATLSFKQQTCPLCKGQKYGFTAYFHNTKVFSKPPHELLAMVERSYLLKNRLKSLLVTYGMREVEQDQLQEVEGDITAWSQQVHDLISEVISSAVEFALDLQWLETVQTWTKDVTKQLREKIWLKEEMEMPNGSLDEVLQGFRKVWEGVWKGYMNDRTRISITECEASYIQDLYVPEI